MKSVSEKLKGMYLYFELISEFIDGVRTVEVKNENILKFKPFTDENGVECNSFSVSKNAYNNKVIDQYWIDMYRFNWDYFSYPDGACSKIIRADLQKGIEAIVKLIEDNEKNTI